jgi:hypothetical protein
VVLVDEDFYGTYGVQISQTNGQWMSKALWHQAQYSTGYSSPVSVQGYVYGLGNGVGIPQCIEMTTGTDTWGLDWDSALKANCLFGEGGLISAGGQLVILSHAGQLVVAEATPTGYRELVRSKILSSDCYNHPALAEGRLYARSTAEAVCVDIADRPPLPLQLFALRPQPSGGLQLQVRDAAGDALPHQRLAHVNILATKDPGRPLSNWSKLTGSVFPDGRFWPTQAVSGQRFFIGVEKP